jgi:ribonuclease III
MQKFAPLEKKIGIKFKEKKFLEIAFTHKSYINEHRDEGLEDNERMEFLGDAVLELISTEHLYKNHPEQNEGEMTNFRSALVQGKNLALIARELELGKYLALSHGEENSGGREKNYILANTLEALIGAIYLDQGFVPAKVFVQNFILIGLDEIIEKKLHIDPKSRFQEIVQEKMEVTPSYEILKEKGPDHDKKFECGVFIKKKMIATGLGTSKQNAEEDAAKKALIKKGWHK